MSEIELHRKLLADRRRNEAFHTALSRVIRPGVSTVIDIGAGTGFLSFLARRIGAKHCTLIEYAGTLELAQTLARSNRIDGLTFMQGHSAEIRRALKADVVVSETLGNYALEEGFLETAVDARRFLKPGGVLIPGRLQQFVAPVFDARLQREIDIWSQVGFDLDLGPARTTSLNNMYVKTVLPHELGDDPHLARRWDDLDLRPSRPPPASRRSSTLQWSGRDLARRQVEGFALWWEAELIEDIGLSTSPYAAPTHWEQIYLPLLQPLALDTADTVELALTSDTRPQVGVRLQWRTRQLRGGKPIGEQSQDSLRGQL